MEHEDNVICCGKQMTRTEIMTGTLREPRPLTIVNARQSPEQRAADQKSYENISRKLNGMSLIFAAILFLCQIVLAGCFCQPVVVMSGLWLAILFLFHAILGNRTVKDYSQSLLIGHGILSLVVVIVGLLFTGIIYSGKMVSICISSFHQTANAPLTGLYIIEITGFVASVPIMLGVVSCLVSAAISFKSAHSPKNTSFVMCLCNSDFHGAPKTDSNLQKVEDHRPITPPPAYQMPSNESFA